MLPPIRPTSQYHRSRHSTGLSIPFLVPHKLRSLPLQQMSLPKLRYPLLPFFPPTPSFLSLFPSNSSPFCCVVPTIEQDSRFPCPKCQHSATIVPLGAEVPPSPYPSHHHIFLLFELTGSYPLRFCRIFAVSQKCQKKF
jgi:hypothetical protein